MKKLIVIFALVLLVAGATIGAMKWFGLGPFEQPEMAAAMEAETGVPRFQGFLWACIGV